MPIAQTQQSQLEKIAISIPTTFFEVNLPECDVKTKCDVEIRRKALSKYNGHVVLISTEHNSLLRMGQIRVDPQDQECYYFRSINGYSERLKEERLWYNDLTKLYHGADISSGIQTEFALEPFSLHS